MEESGEDNLHPFLKNIIHLIHKSRLFKKLDNLRLKLLFVFPKIRTGRNYNRMVKYYMKHVAVVCAILCAFLASNLGYARAEPIQGGIVPHEVVGAVSRPIKAPITRKVILLSARDRFLNRLAQLGASNYEINTLSWICGKESTWNQYAKNPNSTASGLCQYLTSTWRTHGCRNIWSPEDQASCALRDIRRGLINQWQVVPGSHLRKYL